MVKDIDDCEYVLDCFTRPFPVDIEAPDEQEGDDNPEPLARRAVALLRGGRFKALILYRWVGGNEEWRELERFPK